jgi:alkylation response protein AidB-like acyl-CoA dehydrogenase
MTGPTGYLLGEEHKGMRAMFTMMNEARLGVGMQGVHTGGDRLSERAGLCQGPSAGPRRDRRRRTPNGPADPLIVHPDVRRAPHGPEKLCRGRARVPAVGLDEMIDRSHRTNDEDAEGLISLLTPVIKGFLTDKGYDMTILAQQIYGGHGYIEEWGMSQFTRDARIAMIYEGANGVQALDLVGRKLGTGRRQACHGLLRSGEDLHQGERGQRGAEERISSTR